MKFVFRSVPIVVTFAIVLSSAASAGSGALKFPVYEGTIIPIEVPFQPEFRPHRTVMEFEMDLEMKAGRDKAEMEMEVKTEQAVRRSGDKLEWTSDIREMKLEGKRFKSSTPLMTARWITGAGGSIEGFEMAFPGFQEKGGSSGFTSPQKGSPEYESALKQFGANSKLPEGPVTSGSVLFTQELGDLLEEGLPGIDPAALQREVKTMVKGWGYYRDRKVLVAAQVFDAPAAAAGADRLSITLSGYSLFDVDTFAKLKSELVIVMSGVAEGQQVHMVMRGTGEGELVDTK